jgi:hypothetical protein
MRNVVLVALFVSGLVVSAKAQSAPVLTFSVAQITHGEYVKVRGTGFTPNGQVASHLMRPDLTEYPEMPMKADARGVVTHEITIVPNTFGTYELQFVDRTTKAIATQRFLMVPHGFDKPVKSQLPRMPQTFDGVWDGSVTQQGTSSPSRTLISLTGGRIGAVVGTIAYPGLRCGGELWLVSAAADSMQLGEVIMYGQDRCDGRALLTMGRDKSGALTMLWRDINGSGSAQGTLKKRSE